MSFDELGAITGAGWRQGSLLDREAAADIGLALDDIDGWIVASHPCDVVARSLQNEPFVEVIPVKKMDALDGTYSFGGNPRKLHIPIDDTVVEADIAGRRSIARDLLGRVEPRAQLAKRDARTFSQWLGNRYSRPFFPDAFNERRHSSSKRVNTILKKLGSSLSGVYIDMSDEELSENEAYIVTLLFTVTPEVAAAPAAWADANKAADQIVDLWNDEKGIVVDQHFVESEADVPISALRIYVRLDFDSFTIRGDEVGDQPLSISI